MLQSARNPLVLTGDSHNSWAANLRLPTASGIASVGVELATPSVSSPGFEEALPDLPASALSSDDFSGVDVDSGPFLDELRLDRDLSFGLALGRRVWQPVRLEIELAARSADAESLPVLGLDDVAGSVDLRAVMINALADFPLHGGAIVPYVGLGFGWAQIEFDDIGASFLRLSGDEDAFAFQGMAGLAVPVSEQLALTLDVRYLRTDDVWLQIDAGGRLEGQTEIALVGVAAGLRFQF